jgi:hypothetical protein
MASSAASVHPLSSPDDCCLVCTTGMQALHTGIDSQIRYLKACCHVLCQAAVLVVEWVLCLACPQHCQSERKLAVIGVTVPPTGRASCWCCTVLVHRVGAPCWCSLLYWMVPRQQTSGARGAQVGSGGQDHAVAAVGPHLGQCFGAAPQHWHPA